MTWEMKPRQAALARGVAMVILTLILVELVVFGLVGWCLNKRYHRWWHYWCPVLVGIYLGLSYQLLYAGYKSLLFLWCWYVSCQHT